MAPITTGARPAARQVRLTVRGRLILVGLVALLALAAFSMGRATATAATSPVAAPVRFVTVAPGETLWDIAHREAPGVDPRDAVDQLAEINALEAGRLRAGQRLAVPLQR